MWKLEIIRYGIEPQVHENVSLAYEEHRTGIAMPSSETLVAYDSLVQRIRGIQAYRVSGGRLLPEFTPDGFNVKGTGGTFEEEEVPIHPFEIVTVFRPKDFPGDETWHLTVLPDIT